MKASLPEASIRQRLKVSAQVRATARPVFTLPVKAIMFESGEAVIRGGGEKWLAAFLEPLKRAEIKELRVEGHSDNVPIRKGRKSVYPSNWELSAARAATVVRFFVELGMDSAKLAAVGYADRRPVSGLSLRNRARMAISC